MATLKYYITEKIEFKDAFEKDMIYLQTKIVFKKLCKHFKIKGCSLEWTSGRNHPKAFYGYFPKVRMNYDWNNFGVLCHELAHVKLYTDKKIKGHNKRHWKNMEKMIKYCRNKNWFSEELDRRTTIKVKPEPSKEELKAKELIKLQEKIIKYEKKILFYQKKLSKAKRSYTIRLRNINKGSAGLGRASHPYSINKESEVYKTCENDKEKMPIL